MDTSKLQLLRLPRSHEEYDEAMALALIAAAKGQTTDNWPERRLAVLLLENQLIRLNSENLNEFDVVLVHLGLKPDVGHDVLIKKAALSEGFSSLDLRGFVVELLQKLSRLDRVHNQLRNADHDEGAWSYFVRASRDVSKLILARYVFTAQEVADEITRNLVVSKGIQDTAARLEGRAASGWTEALRNVPIFEAEILNRLCASRHIYWVSEGCSSDINSLVEYPLTSAVVVIKPPGSDFEFEIKRAGTRGSRLLNVITERDGKEAPTSHRLFGGSLGWLAKREAESSALFSRIYWLVHGKECPCSRTAMNSSIVSVNSSEGETHIMDYLADEQRFGTGFDATRTAMQVCVESFPSDTGVARANYEGDAGLTLQFIGQALPQQAIIIGSSSFRLDRLCLYLCESGADEYFQTGLGREYSDWEARWFADSLLEEILGKVTPPDRFVDYGQYLRDAFNLPENRARADANYTSVMRQMGECWGTLLAVRGFSDGESFVQRNVGLKSIRSDGGWQIRVIFMDHDDLTVAGYRYRYLWPSREAAGMLRDQVHLLGGPLGDQIIPGDVNALKSIYRVDSETGEAGIKSLEESLVAAYNRTESQLSTNRELQDLFYPEFINRFADFDEIAAEYLRLDRSQIDVWKSNAAAYLRARDYGEDLISESIDAICRCRDFFERMRFLYCR